MNRVKSVHQSVSNMVRAFASATCFALLLCGNHSSFAVTLQEEPGCGPFWLKVSAECTPEYQNLLKEYRVVDQEERMHKECIGELGELVSDGASAVKMLNEACLPAYQNVLEAYKDREVAHDKFVRHINSFPDLHNPHTLTRRDVYMGGVGAVIFFFAGVLTSRAYFMKPQNSKFEAPKGGVVPSERKRNGANHENKNTKDLIKDEIKKEVGKAISEVKEASALAMQVASQADEKADRAIEVSSRMTASIAGHNSIHVIGGGD